MKPSRISVALLVLFLLAPALFAQSSDSPNQSTEPFAAAASSTEVPRLIKFSGTLLDERGHVVPGPAGVTFALYARQADGAALWLETQNVKPDANGDYIVLLGANSAKGVPAELFASGEARWLGVQPEGQIEQPRVLLVSVPYALKAGDAETLGGKPASAFALSGSLAGSAGNPSVSQTIVAPVVMATTPGPSADSANIASGGIAAASACTMITADGTALVNQLAKFSGPCQIHQSLLSDNGTTVSVAGAFNLPAVAAATSTLGKNSFSANFTASSFSSSTHLPVNQNFRWQAEPVGNNTSSPSGKLNLLYASGTGTPGETGLSISNKGLITFASGQTLPTITGNESVTGNVSANQLQSNVATGTTPLVVKSTTQVSNLNASFLGGMPASSFATHGANSFFGTQSIFSGPGMFLGDPGCGSQFAGIAFAAFFGCTNYSLLGDGVNTFIGKPPNGTVFFIGLSETGRGVTDMQINPDGLVGIGTATPSAQLAVVAHSGLGGISAFLSQGEDSARNGTGTARNGGTGVNAFGGLALDSTGGGGDGVLAAGGSATVGLAAGGNGVSAFGGSAVLGGGGLGGFGIFASGGKNSDGSLARAGEFQGDVEITGCLSVSPNTSAHAQFGSCLSDVRLKKSIQPFPAVLDNLVRLQPVSYNWRTEEYPQFRFSSGRTIGLIAQEVEKVFPDMVSTDEAGYKRVNYGELPYLMLQAIRELKTENDNLRERLQRLEAATMQTP
jgi:hypothetical protein